MASLCLLFCPSIGFFPSSYPFLLLLLSPPLTFPSPPPKKQEGAAVLESLGLPPSPPPPSPPPLFLPNSLGVTPLHALLGSPQFSNKSLSSLLSVCGSPCLSLEEEGGKAVRDGLGRNPLHWGGFYNVCVFCCSCSCCSSCCCYFLFLSFSTTNHHHHQRGVETFQILSKIKGSSQWINQYDNKGYTPLLTAVRFADISVVEMLLTGGVFSEKANSCLPLKVKKNIIISFMSVFNAILLIFSPFLQKKNQRKNGYFALHLAARTGNKALFSLVYQHMSPSSAPIPPILTPDSRFFFFF